MKKSKNIIIESGKGLLTGASMVVPGISGGTMALIFGFYDKLISAAAGIFKNFKNNFLTILLYLVTVGLGFVVFTWPMTYLIENFAFITYCFFVGTLVGSLALFKKKAKISGYKISDLLFFIIGVGISFGITLIPEKFITYSADGGFFGNIWLYLISGVLIAIALILPGISLSHILLVLGIYDLILTWVKELKILELLPFGIVSIVFVFALVKILEYALNKQSRITYTVISGFVLFSAFDIARENLYPVIAAGGGSDFVINLLAGILLFIAGLFLTYVISKKSV